MAPRKRRFRRKKKAPAADGIEQIAKATGNIVADAKRINEDPRLVAALQKLRKVLPGDSALASPDELGEKQPQVLSRLLSDVDKRRPNALGQAGLGTLQIWKAIAESREDEEEGDEELTIVFTDLVEFSSWALEAGDDHAVELLHSVSAAIEPPVLKQKGTVVKRLGDGMMAVFSDPGAAISALTSGQKRVAKIEVGGYTPKMRAGLHVGHPRRVDEDYFGVDVNIAARVTEAAGAGEILASGQAVSALGERKVKAERKGQAQAKGVPEDLELYSVKPK